MLSYPPRFVLLSLNEGLSDSFMHSDESTSQHSENKPHAGPEQ